MFCKIRLYNIDSLFPTSKDWKSDFPKNKSSQIVDQLDTLI